MTNMAKSESKNGLTRIICCKNCTDRYPACHDKCETYLYEKSLVEQFKYDLRKERMIDEYNIVRHENNKAFYAKKQRNRKH